MAAAQNNAAMPPPPTPPTSLKMQSNAMKTCNQGAGAGAGAAAGWTNERWQVETFATKSRDSECKVLSCNCKKT